MSEYENQPPESAHSDESRNQYDEMDLKLESLAAELSFDERQIARINEDIGEITKEFITVDRITELNTLLNMREEVWSRLLLNQDTFSKLMNVIGYFARILPSQDSE
jgi:hypothetical protein